MGAWRGHGLNRIRRQRGFFTLPGGIGIAARASANQITPGAAALAINGHAPSITNTGDGHRYWRIRQVSVVGYFEISEIQFHDAGGRISGTLASSNAVDFGSLALLNDNDLNSRAYWVDSTATASTFWVSIDCGSDKNVLGVKIGGFDTSGRYPTAIAALEWSDDASSWTSVGAASGLTYPGNNTLSSLIAFS